MLVGIPREMCRREDLGGFLAFFPNEGFIVLGLDKKVVAGTPPRLRAKLCAHLMYGKGRVPSTEASS